MFAVVAAGVHVFISGESLHCFLVGWCTNKSYVIETSALWLHASNLLSLNSPHYHSPTNLALRSGLEVEETQRPGDSVEELSGGTGGSVEELSGGTESVRGDLTTELHLH